MSYQVKVPLRSLPNFKFLFSDKGCFSFQLTKPSVTKKIELEETKQNKKQKKQTNNNNNKNKNKNKNKGGNQV